MMGPPLISYQHETDNLTRGVIGPQLIKPIMMKLITKPHLLCFGLQGKGSGSGVGYQGLAAPAARGLRVGG